mgnify:CR=1 FL=1
MLKDVLMMDVLPTSIGLEDANGKFIPLLDFIKEVDEVVLWDSWKLICPEIFASIKNPWEWDIVESEVE